MTEPKEPGHRAPLIVFGTILLIGATCLTTVLVTHCRRNEPYLDPTWVPYGAPPPPSLPPPPGRPRPADAGP